MHEADGKKNKFYRKTGLIKKEKGHIFDTKSIDIGTSMTKIGPKEQGGTNKHGKRKSEIECKVL